MGSTNMKGFLMSLQKSGKVHHAILVEQVTLGLFIHLDPFFRYTSNFSSSFSAFLLRSPRQRSFTALHPNANRQRGSVREEVSRLILSWSIALQYVIIQRTSLCVAGRTDSAEGFLRDQSCPVCSAACVTATWRTFCSNTSLKTKGTAEHLYRCVLIHHLQKRAVFLDLNSSLVLCRCLMRLVDDFLLITPDQHQAQTFLKYDTQGHLIQLNI